jgi:carotenoid cleavage dioxygenase-like enzyme
VHEPVFIPRSDTSPEGDGYLLAVGQNVAEPGTELYVIDARRMEELARVTLPFGSSPQVHGTWARQADLSAGI